MLLRYIEAFQKSFLYLKTTNFSSLKRVANSSSRKIFREILSNPWTVSSRETLFNVFSYQNVLNFSDVIKFCSIVMAFQTSSLRLQFCLALGGLVQFVTYKCRLLYTQNP